MSPRTSSSVAPLPLVDERQGRSGAPGDRVCLLVCRGHTVGGARYHFRSGSSRIHRDSVPDLPTPELEQAMGLHVLLVLKRQSTVWLYREQHDLRRDDLDAVPPAPLDGALGLVARGDQRTPIGM